jgi:hypothetical protein
MSMAISKQEILVELRKFVNANNGAIPGERTFVAATRIKQSAWKGRYWARWTDAVREAGFDPNAMTQKIPEGDIMERLAAFISKLGHFPVRDEINIEARAQPGFPVWQTIRKRYGGMPATATELLEFSRETGNAPLSRLCEERLDQEASKPTAAAESSGSARNSVLKAGFVYLKYSPSLRLYKIGKANDANKRGAGISLLLPEDLVPKHEIRTDCPYILEKYWENRFRARKKTGRVVRTDLSGHQRLQETQGVHIWRILPVTS